MVVSHVLTSHPHMRSSNALLLTPLVEAVMQDLEDRERAREQSPELAFAGSPPSAGRRPVPAQC